MEICVIKTISWLWLVTKIKWSYPIKHKVVEPKIWHLEKMKAKLKCWFETFDFNLPKSQTKRIKPKYFASVIKLKDLKSMIFEHQTISLRSLGFWSHSNPRNKKPLMKRKKERKKKKNMILIVENEKK